LLKPFLKVRVSKEPFACALYPVLYAILIPLIGGILGALSEAKELETLKLPVGEVLIAHFLLQVEGSFCNT